MKMFENLSPQKKLFQQLVGATLVLGTVLCIYQPDSLFLRGFTRFAPQITVGYWLLGLVFLATKNARLTMVAFICCGFLCLVLKKASDSKVENTPVSNTTNLSVAQINLSLTNSNHTETLESIRKTNADVLSIQEVDYEWSQRLKDSISSLYPFRCRVNKSDLLGIEVFSKFAFVSCDTFYSENAPNLIVSIKKNPTSRPFHIISTYVMPPLFSSAYQMMQKQMKVIADRIKTIKNPLLTVGDYNIEASSFEVQQFRQQAGLLNSRRGFRPSREDGSFDITEVPTDHIFFTPDLECTHFETIVGAKSEHLGIYGTFQIANPPSDVSKKN